MGVHRAEGLRCLVMLILACVGAAGLVACNREPRDWEAAKNANTLQTYRQYIAAHPKGEHATEASTRIEQIEWDNARAGNTVASYRAFLDRFATGPHGKTAREAVEALEWESAKVAGTLEGVTAFLVSHPYGVFAAQAKDLKANLEMPEIEGELTAQMTIGGFGGDGSMQVGSLLLTMEHQGTVYQLLRDADTKYKNIEVTKAGINWDIDTGIRYRVRGVVSATKPAAFANVSQVDSSKPFRFIVVKEITRVKAGK